MLPSFQTSADKADILIGEQVRVTVKAVFRTGLYKINWLALPDSISHFEVVDPGKADSSNKDNSTTITQTITFTSFDSGKWIIPPFLINFDPVQDDTSYNLFTKPVPVNVFYSPPDSTNQLRDIKPIMDVKLVDYTWYYISGGVLLLILLGFLLWRYLKNRKPKPAHVMGSRLSAYEEAMQELEKLKQYDLQQPIDVKTFHTRLSVIFKRYLGRKKNKQLDNRTTGDLLIIMAENVFRQDDISTLATALRCSDAVKFAKYLPSMVESNDCQSKIKEIINLIEQQTIHNKP